MEEIKISDLPEYAKNSKIYEGMEADEVVFVPKKFLIYNEKINNFKDYKKLIKSYNYFLLELSDEIIKFQKDQKNEYDVLHFLNKNKDILFFREQLENLENRKIKIEYFLDTDYFNKNKKIAFNLRYVFQQGTFKIMISDIFINEKLCIETLNKIKESEYFSIISSDHKLFVDFKNENVFFTEFTKTFFLSFDSNKKHITKIHKKLFEDIEKYKTFIKSEEIFGILDENFFMLGIMSEDDGLVIESVNVFFDIYFFEGLTEKNVKEYLENENRIIYN
uniref:Uncharacterized protein n=1 Tax=viral metagenome TaxID=1070528 RepID=A0A6C0AE52_9ZZZZ